MNLLANVVLTVQILSALGVIGLVLIQHGKGADMGAAFGSGGSGSLFGATGGGNFLSRSTAAPAAGVFLCPPAPALHGHAPPASPRRAHTGSAAAIPGAATPAAPAVQAPESASSGAGQTPAK